MKTESNSLKDTGAVITPLRAEDLEAVIAIDKKLSGRSRRGFFDKRLAAALNNPGEFVYVGLRDNDQLLGYALARLVDGEFGKSRARAALDAIGVDPDHQGESIGHQLIAEVEKVLRHKGVGELTSQVQWADQDLLSFFESIGFEVAQRVVLARPTALPLS
jgi:ribosomal protein S18 acetylase RimI-like enzyme